MSNGQFQKGQPRPLGAGRKAGTPNKRTQDLTARIEAAGVDPCSVLLELLTDDDKALRFAAAKELMAYLHPKRKSVEVRDSEQDSIRIILEDYTTSVGPIP